MSPLLEVVDAKKHFQRRRSMFRPSDVKVLRAVDGVSLSVARGETLALVGESGCGKSTLARLVLRILDLTAGRVIFDGKDITSTSGAELRALRRRMQMVFQDPFASLNPKMNVQQIVEEPLYVHGVGDRAERRERLNELLAVVGLDPSYAERRPSEFSGGQRQRIGIARALALQPELIVCDEPVSALDVSIQAQVINLLKDLQARFGLAYLFISHDLAIVKHMADRVAVMYLGRIVETGTRDDLFKRSLHPYTRSLLASIPGSAPRARRERSNSFDEMPSPLALPAGCRFHGRCPYAIDICKTDEPPLENVGEGHFSACHRWRELPAQGAPGVRSTEQTPVARRLQLYEQERANRRAASA